MQKPETQGGEDFAGLTFVDGPFGDLREGVCALVVRKPVGAVYPSHRANRAEVVQEFARTQLASRRGDAPALPADTQWRIIQLALAVEVLVIAYSREAICARAVDADRFAAIGALARDRLSPLDAANMQKQLDRRPLLDGEDCEAGAHEDLARMQAAQKSLLGGFAAAAREVADRGIRNWLDGVAAASPLTAPPAELLQRRPSEMDLGGRAPR